MVHTRGCDIEGNSEAGEVDATLAQARSSDVVVLVIGEDHYAERFGDIDGKGASLSCPVVLWFCFAVGLTFHILFFPHFTDLTLPRGQLELTRSLIATGTPVVVILVEGRPRVLEDALDGAAAVLHGGDSFLVFMSLAI